MSLPIVVPSISGYIGEGVDVEGISDTGETVLWIAFGGLFLPCIWFFISAQRQEDGKRYYHILSFMINAIASTAYLAMANGYGSVYVLAGTTAYRQFYYARYVDWALTTPLMLLDLASLANASKDVTLMLLSCDFFMIVAGLIGGLIGNQDDASWAFWFFGCLFYLPIAYYLTIGLPGDGCGEAAAGLFRKAGIMTLVLWSAYPVVWILAEGTGTISSDLEVGMYMILDILAKSGFGLLITMSRDGLDQALEKGKKLEEDNL